MLHNVVLTFESVDEILKCDHSNKSYRAVLYCGAVCLIFQKHNTCGPDRDILVKSFIFSLLINDASKLSQPLLHSDIANLYSYVMHYSLLLMKIH